MSIEFWALEDKTAEDHALHVQNLRNQGWERVFTVVDSTRALPFISYMERDTAQATIHKNGVYLASLMEVLEKRVTEHDARLEVLEATADTDDENPGERIKVFDIHGTLIDLIDPRKSQFIPLGNVYDEVVYGALLEDEARSDGPIGNTGPIGYYAEGLIGDEQP